MLGVCCTDNPNKIAKWVGELTYSLTVANVEGATIQGRASSLKCAAGSAERGDAPICDLPRSPRRNLGIGNVKTQLRGAYSDARKVLVGELRTLTKDMPVPFSRRAHGRYEHENVGECLEHSVDA